MNMQKLFYVSFTSKITAIQYLDIQKAFLISLTLKILAEQCVVSDIDVKEYIAIFGFCYKSCQFS